MNRRLFIRNGMATSAGLALGLGQLPALAKSSTTITILHTNDTHSRLDPFPNDGRKWGGLGGIARRAALVEKLRKQQDNILLLDSGDIFQGTPYFNFFGGEPELKAMSAMGYDAATLGNHDFDNGLAGLERMLPFANFPYLIANYDFSKTSLKNSFKPYKIFNKAGIKIGVFGLGIAFEGLVLPKAYGETIWNDPLPIAKEMVHELKVNQGCHYIICLSHLGLTYPNDKVSDRKLAQSTPGLDLILGGHTHTFMENAERVVHPNGQETLINQVGWAGIWLGRIDLEFTPGKVAKTIALAPIGVSEKNLS